MKVLIFAHKLEVGGTQVNAIELATQLRDAHGHEVILFAVPGPMVALVENKGLRYTPAPGDPGLSLRRMRQLYRLAKAERPDLIHVWDAPQYLEAMFAVHLRTRIPMLVTSMAMVVNNEFPKHIWTTFGTPDLVAQANRSGRRARLLLPPVDMDLNQPMLAQGRDFRSSLSLTDKDIVLVTVSRLVHWMKAESLKDTIEAVRSLGRDAPLHLVIVGDGAARTEVEALALDVNGELGRNAIHVVGAMLDPGPAYAAADIAVGMGGSALRGMAFAKPTLVVGEKGFSAIFDLNTAPSFYEMGIYGLGDGRSGREKLMQCIIDLTAFPDRLPELGAFSRSFVTRNFSLNQVAADLHQIMLDCLDAQPNFWQFAADVARTTALFIAHRLLPYRSRAFLQALSSKRLQAPYQLQRLSKTSTSSLADHALMPRGQGADPPS